MYNKMMYQKKSGTRPRPSASTQFRDCSQHRNVFVSNVRTIALKIPKRRQKLNQQRSKKIIANFRNSTIHKTDVFSRSIFKKFHDELWPNLVHNVHISFPLNVTLDTCISDKQNHKQNSICTWYQSHYATGSKQGIISRLFPFMHEKVIARNSLTVWRRRKTSVLGNSSQVL